MALAVCHRDTSHSCQKGWLHLPLSDLTIDAFLILRDAFFDGLGHSKPFLLRDKANTQDDPLDEYIAALLEERLRDATCQKSSGPLISPDMVIYRPDECANTPRNVLRNDVSRIVAIEVKKVERQRSGQVARSTGMDYNTTPPCGTARVYDISDRALDIRAFYLFVCTEKSDDSEMILTALALCDGNALNADFQLYLDITGLRTKGLGLGTYADGVNRNRPMLIFANPLGAPQLDHAATLITNVDLSDANSRLGMVYHIGRMIPEGGRLGMFYAYRNPLDIPPEWEVQRLLDPFPKPVRRVEVTQSRGRFRLPLRPQDNADAIEDIAILPGNPSPVDVQDEAIE